jgi:hypothetical protein
MVYHQVYLIIWIVQHGGWFTTKGIQQSKMLMNPGYRNDFVQKSAENHGFQRGLSKTSKLGTMMSNHQKALSFFLH